MCFFYKYMFNQGACSERFTGEMQTNMRVLLSPESESCASQCWRGTGVGGHKAWRRASGSWGRGGVTREG